VELTDTPPNKELQRTRLQNPQSQGSSDRGSNSLGHKSIKTTQRYLGVSTELRREAVNRLNFPEADQPAE
jgi:hypothetical protein